MADLDTLRPEVLEALEVCTRGVDPDDEGKYVAVTVVEE